MGHSYAKGLDNDAKMVPLGTPCGSEGPARDVLNHLGNGLGVTLGSVGVVFYDLLETNVIL